MGVGISAQILGLKGQLDYPPSSAARQPNLVASNPADIGKPGFLNDANQG